MTLRIREQEYRGQAGWTVRGKDLLGRKVAIWCHFQDTAEGIKQLVRAGRNEEALGGLLREDQKRFEAQGARR